MVDDMYVGAKGETFQACDYAQRFGIERIRTANGFFEDSRKNDFCICRSRGSV